jgi:hypothetical protein
VALDCFACARNDNQNPNPNCVAFSLNCQPRTIQQVRRQPVIAENDERQRSGFSVPLEAPLLNFRSANSD